MKKLIPMRRFSVHLTRRVLVLCTVLATAGALTSGALATASVPIHQSVTSGSVKPADAPDPCGQNSPQCDGIGVTDSWYNGNTLDLNYSHRYFCGDHSLSQATTGCEIGASTNVAPPSGEVVSPVYVMTPIGFTPPNLQCPKVGNCIDHPHRVDASRVFGPSASNALLPAHSHIIKDREGALSSWWPVVVIGVTNQTAWNQIAMGKSLGTVYKIRRMHPNWVTANIPSNIYLFFQAIPGGDNN
ncbi:MAG: hypothetical protein ACR2KG_04500 [Nocardioidaceae bacterium]